MNTVEILANGPGFCPAFEFIQATPGATVESELGVRVFNGFPEPSDDEKSSAQWFEGEAILAVGANDDGSPRVGDDGGVISVGKGTGMLLMTERRTTGVLMAGSFLGEEIGPRDDRALLFTFAHTDVTGLEPQTKSGVFGSKTRGVIIDLSGSSWGTCALIIDGVVLRSPGERGGRARKSDATSAIELIRRGMPRS